MLRITLAIVMLCGTGMLAAEDPVPPPTEPIPFSRIRATDERLSRLVAAGYTGSGLFRSLVDQVEQLNVLVYIQLRPGLTEADGSLQVAGKANGERVLVIFIRDEASFKPTIAMIAHELQHVLEVGSAPEIVDQATLRAFYQRYGERGTSPLAYDTVAAQDVGVAVLTELLRAGSIPDDATWPDVLRRWPAVAPEFSEGT